MINNWNAVVQIDQRPLFRTLQNEENLVVMKMINYDLLIVWFLFDKLLQARFHFYPTLILLMVV